MRLLKVCFRLLESLTRGIGYIAGILILLTSFIIVYEIIMRGLFTAPTSWVSETSIYFIIGAAFFGLSYSLQTNHHIQVDIITSKLSQRTKSALDVFTSLLALVFCFILVWKAWEMVHHAYLIKRVSPTPLRMPMYIPQATLLIGSVMLLLQFVRRALISWFIFRGNSVDYCLDEHRVEQLEHPHDDHKPKGAGV